MVSPEQANWIGDFGAFIDDDPTFSVTAWQPSPIPLPPPPSQNHPLVLSYPNPSPNLSVEIDGSFADSVANKETCTKKRVRTESCGTPTSKACREKLRRDKLNDRFMELGAILEPGRAPKTDKSAILVDAVRMVTQMRSEAQKLKDSNMSLQEKIKELKDEKNELRDEKQRLKGEKDKLEQQLKTMSVQPNFLPSPTAIPAAFAAQGQAPGNKMVPFIGYPGVAMWQFMPPASVDTSQDHVLRPPVA